MTVDFDQAPATTGDWFVRHQPAYLQMFYGTEDVTPMWVADMDLPVAPPITEALQYVAGRGQFAYEFNSEGIYGAMSGWFQRRHDLALDPGKFVTFPGVLTAISILLRELTEDGAGVLMRKVIRCCGRYGMRLRRGISPGSDICPPPGFMGITRADGWMRTRR